MTRRSTISSFVEEEKGRGIVFGRGADQEQWLRWLMRIVDDGRNLLQLQLKWKLKLGERRQSFRIKISPTACSDLAATFAKGADSLSLFPSSPCQYTIRSTVRRKTTRRGSSGCTLYMVMLLLRKNGGSVSPLLKTHLPSLSKPLMHCQPTRRKQ